MTNKTDSSNTCPCGMYGPCCSDPQLTKPEHDEPENEEFCEECYGLECLNCGKVCYHEL